MHQSGVKTILLIDDDEDEYDMIIEAIKKIDPGVKVFFLDRIEECLKYKGKEFDLILLDINMPQHDGFSWLRQIRNKNRDVAVVMYSNSSNPANIARAYNEGANLFFNKPESYSLLITGIKKLLNLDWRHPLSITSEYIQEGKYLTFQEA